MDGNLQIIEGYEGRTGVSPELEALLRAMAVVILEQQERIEALENSIDPESVGVPGFPTAMSDPEFRAN